MMKNKLWVAIALLFTILCLVSCEYISDIATVTFDLNGAGNTWTVGVKNGEKISEPTTPSRNGYVFEGWYLGEEKFDFSTPITKNIKLIAKWAPKSPIVTFDSNGGTEVSSIQLDYGTKLTLPSNPTREGYYFLGWTFDENIFNSETLITNNITLRALWGAVTEEIDEYVAYNAITNIAYIDLSEAISNANSGDKIKLYKDVTLSENIELKDSITIEGVLTGEGQKPIIKSGEGIDRVINITETTNNISIIINNINIVGPTTGTYTRGISAYDNSGKIYIELNNCVVSCNYYAINIASDNSNAEVVANNSTISGWCAVQTWSSNSKFEFNNCKLIGLNDKSYNAVGWNDFGTVVVNEDSDKSTFIFNNTQITAKETTGNIQIAFDLRGTNTTIKLDNNSQIILDGNNAYSYGDTGENNIVYKNDNLVPMKIADLEQISIDIENVVFGDKTASGTLKISCKGIDYSFELRNCPTYDWGSGTEYICIINIDDEMLYFDFDVSITAYPDTNYALYLTEFIK